MITPSEIKKKAEKQYLKFLISLITKEEFFPLNFPVGKLPSNYVELHQNLRELLQNSHHNLLYGYTVRLETVKTRNFGEQSLPKQILIETEIDYLKLLKKEREVKNFKQNIELILTEIPQLSDWIINNPLQVIKYEKDWQNLLKVCHYFLKNPQPNLYIRELPIQIHTKFIENHQDIITRLLTFLLPSELINQNDKETEQKFEKKFNLKYDEPLIRIRILDPKLTTKYHLPFTDFSIPISELKQLNWQNHHFVITENKMSFLTLPLLENTLAIWGSGYKVQILKNLKWLSQSTLFYWGDLDIDGFKILAQLRSYFPNVISLMMDQETLTLFKDFIGEDTSGSKVENLTNLTTEENTILAYLFSHKKRLEQEQINQDYVNKYLFKKLNF